MSLNKNINVNSALKSKFNSLTSRRMLSRDGAKNLEDLEMICENYSLSDMRDKVIWCLTRKDFLLNPCISIVEAILVRFHICSFGREESCRGLTCFCDFI